MSSPDPFVLPEHVDDLSAGPTGANDGGEGGELVRRDRTSPAAQVGAITSFTPLYLPLVLPYYVARTWLSVVTFPARVAFHVLMYMPPEDSDEGLLAGAAKSTGKFIYESAQPYLDVALHVTGHDDVARKLEEKVERLTRFRPATPFAQNKGGVLTHTGDIPATDTAGSLEEQPVVDEPPQLDEMFDYGVSGSREDDPFDMPLEPLSPMSSFGDLPTATMPAEEPAEGMDESANGGTGAAHTQRATANTSDERVKVHSKTLKPRSAVLFFEDDSLAWSFESKYHSLKGVRKIALEDITAISLGKRTDAFSKKAGDVPADRCLSAISMDKVVAVEFRDRKARDVFAEQLQLKVGAARALKKKRHAAANNNTHATMSATTTTTTTTHATDAASAPLSKQQQQQQPHASGAVWQKQASYGVRSASDGGVGGSGHGRRGSREDAMGSRVEAYTGESETKQPSANAHMKRGESGVKDGAIDAATGAGAMQVETAPQGDCDATVSAGSA